MQNEPNLLLTIDDVKEAFDGTIEADVVVDILHKYIDKKNAAASGLLRMQRTISILDGLSSLSLLVSEGGDTVDVRGPLSAAADYLEHYGSHAIVDDLDMEARTVALYIVATVDTSIEAKTSSVEAMLEELTLADKMRAELSRQGYVLRFSDASIE